MTKLWVWSAVFATTLAAAGAAMAADACRMVKVAELPVKFERNRPMIRVGINGKPAWLMVDTGAASTTLFGGAARQLGLSESTAEGVRFYGVGGSQQAYTSFIRELQIEGVKTHNTRMFVIGAGGSPEDAGLLGRDLLGNWDLEFDLAAKTIRLWTPQNCGARSLAYWTQEPELAQIDRDDAGDEYRVRIKLNGKPFEATLDSGAQTSVVTQEMADSAGAATADYAAGVVYSHGIGDTVAATRTATFKDVQIGDETVSHARLQVSDLFAADTERRTGSILARPVEGLRNPPMLLGADFLRSHRVLIAGSQRKLYFTYSGGPVFQSVGDATAPKDAAPSAAKASGG